MASSMGRMRRGVKRARRASLVCFTAAGLIYVGWACSAGMAADSARASTLDVAQIHKAATDANSLYLDEGGRVHAVEAFQRLVRIKGPSGQEEAVRKEVQRMLSEAGAVVVPTEREDQEAPYNLVMELPGSGVLAGRPGILLNAHLDTIHACTPEFMEFDAKSGDFYHRHEAESDKPSSFGGDDRSAVAVIVEAVRWLQAEYWSQGVPHRRILLVFTADEERGCIGAKYLREHAPEVFADLEISLSIDGPLDFRSDYPRDSFVLVVSASDSGIMPYEHMIELTEEFCKRTGTRFGQTEIGLGMGDFAHFPACARAGLHLRSVVRGFHRRERVNVQDLVSQIDLLCFLLLGWDRSPSEGEAGGVSETAVIWR